MEVHDDIFKSSTRRLPGLPPCPCFSASNKFSCGKDFAIVLHWNSIFWHALSGWRKGISKAGNSLSGNRGQVISLKPSRIMDWMQCLGGEMAGFVAFCLFRLLKLWNPQSQLIARPWRSGLERRTDSASSSPAHVTTLFHVSNHLLISLHFTAISSSHIATLNWSRYSHLFCIIIY